MTKSFDFQVGENGELTLEEAVFQALGAASVCWSESPTGEFDSERAKAIGDRLVGWINTHVEQVQTGSPQQGALTPRPSRWRPISPEGKIGEPE